VATDEVTCIDELETVATVVANKNAM